MVNIDWCKKQKKGIVLIEPNDNLSEEYIKTAEETLEILRSIKNKSRVWLAITKYYCEYFAVYSFLMKIGIKSEIHDCTIEIAKLLEEKGILPEGYAKILNDDKRLRIDNQYYLKNREVIVDYDSILEFVLKIKDINNKLTKAEIIKFRRIVQSR